MRKTKKWGQLLSSVTAMDKAICPTLFYPGMPQISEALNLTGGNMYLVEEIRGSRFIVRSGRKDS